MDGLRKIESFPNKQPPFTACGLDAKLQPMVGNKGRDERANQTQFRESQADRPLPAAILCSFPALALPVSIVSISCKPEASQR